jgi:signal transduction histidine kinase
LDAPMRIPRSDLFAITVYYNNRNYAKVFSKYHALRPELQELSGTVADGAVSRAQAYVALAILNSVVYAAYKTGDSSLANEGIGITEKMLGEIRGLPGKYKGDTTLYNYIYHTMLYDREKYRDHTDRGAAGGDHFTRAGEFLQMAIREVRSGDFPPNYQPAYTEELYGDAFDFYFDHGKKDSARLYLDRVRAMNDSLVKYSSMDRSFQLESSSKLLAANGEYRAAYDDLLNVYRVKDSAFYAVSTDKENNLYALAEADNSRSELLRAEAARRKAEQSTLFLSVLLTFLVLGGIAGFLVYRSRQRQRLLNWQLQLARDFHDEIGPQLLYAGILLKKEAEARPSERLEELKGQVSNIMEAVRGISHDLKSNEPGTVGTFYKEIATLLEKIRASTHIDFTIRMNNGQRVLNHWQYTHLHKMLNELIGNSIKHAGCSRIAVKIMAAERELRINYSDDGKGMEPGVSAAGIGLRNMEERAVLLKGHFRLENAWPEGYSVDISIPLV